MADKTGIEWTDATWNPIVGCSIVSPGCTHCYAMRQALRIQAMMRAQGKSSHYDGTTKLVNGNPVWTGVMRQAPENILLQPLRWTQPRRIFVNSMSDLFHEDVPIEWIDAVFEVMARCPQHQFQVLTKRAQRMRDYLTGFPARRDLMDCHAGLDWVEWPLPNIWLGVSTEDQRRYDERKGHLRDTPAAVRFFSMEPLLGPIKADYLGDWVIVGGESGPGARPLHPDWARSLRDQCAAAGVPFFFKQWGEWEAWTCAVEGKTHMLHLDGKLETWRPGDPEHKAILRANYPYQQQSNAPRARPVARVGKRYAGRLLDGSEHNAMPEVRR